MKRKITAVVIIILVILTALIFLKDVVARTAISAVVKAMTGLKLDIDSMNVGIVNSLVRIRGLKLFNPPEFKDKLMMNMPEIYVNYDLGSFLKGKTHLEEVRLDLMEFVVVKNEDGEINLDSLKVVQEKKKEPAPEKKKEKKSMDIKIDVMELKVGQVIYKDYSKGTPPKITVYAVNINERYENITNLHTFASLVVTRALMKTAISRLAGFDMGPLTEGLGGILGTVGGTATDAAEGAVDLGKDIGKTATDTLKKILPLGK